MNNTTPPPLYRRLGALFYDSILIVAILLTGTAIAILFTRGHSISPGDLYYQSYLIFLTALFFIGFWCHGGQTIGMRAFGLQLLTIEERPVSYRQALFRFILAIPSFLFFGLGFLWLLFNKDKLTLYDKLSKTKIIRT